MAEWTLKSVDGVDVDAPKEETPVAEEQQGIKGAPVPEDEVIKVDLSNPPKKEEESDVEEVSEETTDEAPETEVSEDIESPIELITEENPSEVKDETPEVDAGRVEQQPQAADPAPKQEEAPQPNLPENVEKLVAFMEETGGTLEDYVNLNKDLGDYNDNDLLFEYYKQTKGWEADDIREHISDSFSYDEELDEPRDVRARKREFKAELKAAKDYLKRNKEQYYEDLKLRPRQDVDPEYQKAYDFANSYRETQQQNEQLKQTFSQRTEQVFNEDFKGFDFKVGENKYRYKVNEPQKVKQYQSDINNFVGEFLAEDGTINDAAGYHKALFAAKNADKLAQHFYEQGRAEALKQQAAEAKNINMGTPRGDASSVVGDNSGPKVRVVNDGGSGSRLRFKNYKNR